MPQATSLPDDEIKYSSDVLEPSVQAEALQSTSRSALKLYLVTVMSSVNGMEQYLNYFKLSGKDAGGGVGSITGLIFAMFTLGTCVTALVAGPLADRFGRRGAMLCGGILGVLGSVVVTFAQDVAYLKGGRFFIGMSTALLQVSAPMYVTEISPPQAMARSNDWCIRWYVTASRHLQSYSPTAIAIIASIFSGAVTTVSCKWATTLSWRLPLGLQIIPATGVALFSMLIPESPRWLMSVGRTGEAKRVLREYHGNGNDHAQLVISQLDELTQSIKADAVRKSWWDYASLFQTKGDCRRSALILLLAFCSQWAGSGLESFLVVLLAHDHISTQHLRILLSLVNNIIGSGGALLGAFFSDKIGRRHFWFWGTVCCTASILISGACTAVADTNLAAANAAITFLCWAVLQRRFYAQSHVVIFNFFFCATYVPLPATYVPECLTFEKRANGVAMYTLCASLASLVNTYATPVALANIQWRLYFVFIGWDVFACILIFFFAVETSGKTLCVVFDLFPAFLTRDAAGKSLRGFFGAPMLDCRRSLMRTKTCVICLLKCGCGRLLSSAITAYMPATHNEILQQFRKEVESEGILKDGDTIGTDDETLLRFLRARKFDIKQSKKMLAEAQQWRKTVRLDQLYAETDPFDYPERDAVFNCWPLYFHKLDKKGRPVNIHHLGVVDFPKLYKTCTPERHFESLLVNAECLPREVLPACSRVAAAPVSTVLVIIDLTDFSMSKFWQMKSLARTSFQISQDYFPETMGQLIIVNAPSSFTFIWSMMKPWLSKETAEKVDIIGHDYQSALLDVVDADALPAVLGGECRCEEGCHLSSAGPWLDDRKGWGPKANSKLQNGDLQVKELGVK
ncbi:MFS domain-containing protein [Mycena indigotica]|uniref:MFS domain-containing protein n=1 Tax=Mycena indigotica TaxID=2126181 RepID=A0A8H6SHM1_9AGAR|nr:MFS domain-containing protein [Mycena indigotica]KAF7299032.1 MFS domain-containing protein [Mycena indigotica]